MRYALSLTAILLLATAAAAQGGDTTATAARTATTMSAADRQWLTRETATWQAVKDRKADAFGGFLAPGYQSVSAGGVSDKASELRAVPQVNMRSFRLSDFAVRRVDPQTVILTYKAVVEGDVGGTDISGAYWNTSIWRRASGQWRAILHTEAKAQ